MLALLQLQVCCCSEHFIHLKLLTFQIGPDFTKCLNSFSHFFLYIFYWNFSCFQKQQFINLTNLITNVLKSFIFKIHKLYMKYEIYYIKLNDKFLKSSKKSFFFLKICLSELKLIINLVTKLSF